MNKDEFIKKLEDLFQEIALLELCKESTLEYLYHLKNEHRINFQQKISYKTISNKSPWSLHLLKTEETLEELEERLRKHLPVFESYFIYFYSLYEGYCKDNGIENTDQNDVEMLKYRLYRNALVHNLGIVTNRIIEEFDKKAREYNPSLTCEELKTIFIWKTGAKIFIFPEDLLKFYCLVKKLLNIN